jgi:hypothetical protein
MFVVAYVDDYLFGYVDNLNSVQIEDAFHKSCYDSGRPLTAQPQKSMVSQRIRAKPMCDRRLVCALAIHSHQTLTNLYQNTEHIF